MCTEKTWLVSWGLILTDIFFLGNIIVQNFVVLEKIMYTNYRIYRIEKKGDSNEQRNIF